MSWLAIEHNLYHNSPKVCLSVCLSVGVRKLQVAILARSSREMSLTVRIVWHPVTSSSLRVRPSIFLYVKNIHKPSRRPSLAQVSIEWNGAWLAGDRSTVSGKNTSGWCGHSSDRLSQHGKNNKSKRRQREFIPLRLEKCGLGIIT